MKVRLILFLTLLLAGCSQNIEVVNSGERLEDSPKPAVDSNGLLDLLPPRVLLKESIKISQSVGKRAIRSRTRQLKEVLPRVWLEAKVLLREVPIDGEPVQPAGNLGSTRRIGRQRGS